ncbi:MAG: DUF1499 domain-containing protein [Paenisporosarcina sp.]|uniref:DUF1499 domain-containing protein n=1 Tax=Paenisporosarcina sp. TaxID=1932001 RepID=UPI003C767808
MNLGLTNGQLQPVEDKPNSVSSQTVLQRNYMDPIPYTGNRLQSRGKIKAILTNMKRIELVEEQDKYLHYVVTSKVFKFKDDVEFYFDDSNQVIQFRSKSRVGYTDFGVNRKRMKKITDAYKRP